MVLVLVRHLRGGLRCYTIDLTIRTLIVGRRFVASTKQATRVIRRYEYRVMLFVIKLTALSLNGGHFLVFLRGCPTGVNPLGTAGLGRVLISGSTKCVLSYSKYPVFLMRLFRFFPRNYVKILSKVMIFLFTDGPTQASAQGSNKLIVRFSSRRRKNTLMIEGFLMNGLVIRVYIINRSRGLLSVIALCVKISMVNIIMTSSGRSARSKASSGRHVTIRAKCKIIGSGSFVANVDTFQNSFGTSIHNTTAGLTIAAGRLVRVRGYSGITFSFTRSYYRFAVKASCLVNVFGSHFKFRFGPLRTKVPGRIISTLGNLLDISALFIRFLSFSRSTAPVNSNIFGKFFRALSIAFGSYSDYLVVDGLVFRRRYSRFPSLASTLLLFLPFIISSAIIYRGLAISFIGGLTRIGRGKVHILRHGGEYQFLSFAFGALGVSFSFTLRGYRLILMFAGISHERCILRVTNRFFRSDDHFSFMCKFRFSRVHGVLLVLDVRAHDSFVFGTYERNLLAVQALTKDIYYVIVVALARPVDNVRYLSGLYREESTTTGGYFIRRFASERDSMYEHAISFPRCVVQAKVREGHGVVRAFRFAGVVVSHYKHDGGTVRGLLALRFSFRYFLGDLSGLYDLDPTRFLRLHGNDIPHNNFILRIFFRLLASDFYTGFFLFLAVRLLLRFCILLVGDSGADRITVAPGVAVGRFLIMGRGVVSNVTIALTPGGALVDDGRLHRDEFTYAVSSGRRISVYERSDDTDVFGNYTIGYSLPSHNFRFLYRSMLLSPPDKLFFIFCSTYSSPFVCF